MTLRADTTDETCAHWTRGSTTVTVEQRNYGADTWVRQSFPWGTYIGARVLCSDGKVRNVKRIAETADTFFSVPAAVKVQGRTVSGYVTFETLQGFSTPTDDDPTVVKFRAHTYGRNADLLPGDVYRAL